VLEATGTDLAADDICFQWQLRVRHNAGKLLASGTDDGDADDDDEHALVKPNHRYISTKTSSKMLLPMCAQV